MKYQEFFELSKKVELYPFSAQDKMMSGSYKLSVPSSFSGTYVHGLYFPNKFEIITIWNLSTSKENQRGRDSFFKEVSDLKFFIENFAKTINSSYIESVIRDTLNNNAEIMKFLSKEEKKTGNFGLTMNELVEVIGGIYDRMDFLDSDIRIKTLSCSSQANIIMNFKPAVIGYIGNPMISEFKYK
jgi:hypothetical protein